MPAPDLNRYSIPMGNVDLGGSTDVSDIVCCPFGGRLVGVAYMCTEAIDVLGTATLIINDNDDGDHVTFPITADNVGGLALPSAAVYLQDNDSVKLLSVDEPGTGIIDCTLIIER